LFEEVNWDCVSDFLLSKFDREMEFYFAGFGKFSNRFPLILIKKSKGKSIFEVIICKINNRWRLFPIQIYTHFS
jgi:hypothetical protein